MFLPAPDEALWVGVVRLLVRVPGSRSLKDKRREIVRIRDRLRARFNVTVAQVGHLEHHQSAVLALVMVGNEPRFLRSELDKLCHKLEGWSPVLVDHRSLTIIRPHDVETPGGYDEFDG